MPANREIEQALSRFRSAGLLLEEARMVGAPPDCVAERERDLAAARVRLIELGLEPDAEAGDSLDSRAESDAGRSG